ncbi:MAG: hypothetical protein A2599_00175 [Candidatus Staskawiczbacteria bacterium RIFOXYD1_FULL_39_28]|uniref:Uncharacterized protein n=1 Tax=Candidatus Staskawiczbacteria bacterium RIFOXYC1_FULL_38_18 TaxID=1802229 RepID=A0A1G2J9A2_9BACT|nr:MAG: hypothetical protein A2401_03490 [Candidatus Staskawiczbacteria bacterium RIFOXYC1_FULL_38_18]OGZ92156.1 MAG: hypothetical protein A2599_00175 [Candidatus Staskawiczbacteria bacterium RIFOXYD1_FULL_39_28]
MQLIFLKMKQAYNKLAILSSVVFGFLWAGVAKAVCPVCVVAVGAGLGLSRWLGVDDIISGMWIGALLVSITVWTHEWIVKKGWGFKFSLYVIGAIYYALTIVPLYFYDVVGHPLNNIFGIDKFILGVILGTTFFIAAVLLHNFLKTKNNGKSFFPYQKVVVPVLTLIIISLILWMII